MENCRITIENNYLEELRKEFSDLNFNRIKKTNGLYVTNSLNLDVSNDSKIFLETQAKRILRFFFSRNLKKRLSYFSQEEDKDINKMYALDKMRDLEGGEKYAIQNIGHASQLIQVPGFSVMTDPVFGSLNKVLYPMKTISHPDIEKLVKIDVILISHNHRDHVDIPSLTKLLNHYKKNHWHQPKVFVPLGDKKIFENIGFKEIEAVDWFTKISVTKDITNADKVVTFISIPADHRSGRNGYDHHRSLVIGWLIHSEADNVIFKYSGDTRSLSVENQLATDAILWYEIKNIKKNLCSEVLAIPNIICLEPSGPNYTRCYMDLTHQSSSYSALLKFIEAENLASLSGISTIEFLKKMKTIMMHYNKFELGPDRFNEGLFVFKKLVQYLDANQDLDKELERQKKKLEQNLDFKKLRASLPWTSRLVIATLPEHTSLLVHAKDFVIQEIQKVIHTGMDKEQIKEFLIKNTVFLKIGERTNQEQISNIKSDLENIQKYRRNCEFCKINDNKMY